jgi:hypothetical protein
MIESEEGGTPIRQLVIGGHYFPGTGMGGQYTQRGFEGPRNQQYFTANSYKQLHGSSPSFARASQKKGPKRCWFTRKAGVYFSGCYTEDLAQSFANIALRKEALAYGAKWFLQYSAGNVIYGDSAGPSQNGPWEWTGPNQTTSNWKDTDIWTAYFGGL